MNDVLITAILALQKLEPKLRSFAKTRGYLDEEEFFETVSSRCVTYFQRKNVEVGRVEFLIWRIARGKLFDFYRAKSVQPGVCQLDFDPTGHPVPTTNTSTKLDLLRVALSKLPDRAQHAVFWKFGLEWSNQEIADLLEMTKDGVRTLVHRTKKELRKAFDKP